MSRFLVWVALLGLVLLGGFPGPTPARAAPPSQDPNDLCTLLPPETRINPNLSNLERRTRCEGKLGCSGENCIYISVQKNLTQKGVDDSRTMEVPLIMRDDLDDYYTLTDFGDEAFEVRQHWPPQRSLKGYKLWFARSLYVFSASYSWTPRVPRGNLPLKEKIQRPEIDMIQSIARDVDLSIRVVLGVPGPKPPAQPAPPPPPVAKAAPTPATKPPAQPAAKPKAEPKPEPRLTAEEAETKLLEALAGGRKDFYDLVMQHKTLESGQKAAQDGSKAKDAFWKSLGDPRSPTDAQEEAAQMVQETVYFAGLRDKEGQPLFPSVGATLPVIIKLGLRATVDPDAATALGRLTALLIGLDMRAREAQP